ncbi:hypothetical protein FG386_000510 [Cryptosporidium ryanae]|uniref:uncharacterized protein n=1 Tax=Cryptosporidium ryanae TaxID=515981 RepID=UPI00351A43B3|nr:hypothetical protein FG386_000510 [Cryptosporidium ryanae]
MDVFANKHYNEKGEVVGVDINENKCKLLFQGAEAKIFETNLLGKKVIIKHRFQKKYRQAQLDRNLRNSRITKEARNLVKCFINGINCPNVHFVDVQNGIIIIDHKSGVTLNEYLNKICCKPEKIDNSLREISYEIGNAISSLHNYVIHGDLTASNIIVNEEKDENGQYKSLINFIDFGLSYCDSLTIEDKAVDLYVLERSLEVTHPNINIMDLILERYSQTQTNGSQIISKYKQVYQFHCFAFFNKMPFLVFPVKSRGRKKD